MVIDESIVIHASLAAVWETFTDISHWKEWNSVLADCSDADSSSLSLTNQCTWRIRLFAFPIYFEPVIETIVPCELIVWRARKFGIAARHEFIFKNEGDNVRFQSRETFATWPPLRFIVVVFCAKLTAITRAFLNDVKKAVECSHHGAVPQNKDHS
jgi:hypothetical protein